ncbi:MAG: transglutaminase-like domain-containing protein [Methyloceanibacter sp.]
MKIHAGYEISYDCLQPTPMILTLSVHPSRRPTLLTSDRMLLDPLVPTKEYCDGFGNICHVIRAPAGRLTISADFHVQDSGEKDEVAPDATQRPLETLSVETLVYLLGSRYCETDRLSNFAWSTFGKIPQGWTLVQAIVDYVHDHVTFGYPHANATRTAFDTFAGGKGVCRDFAHLAVTLCRCMNVPARYCTGYLGDIGVPPDPAPMDFSAWFEAYIGDRWYTFDARHNEPRIGRILIARGRDATDVAITTSYGPHLLAGFKVVTDEMTEAEGPAIS